MIIIGLLLFSSVQILLEDVAVSAAPGEPDPQGTLTISGSHIIEDHQVWGDVVVSYGGRLVVANGGHLETSRIILKERSTLDVRAGRITCEDHTYREWVGILGECDRFIVTHQSVITVRGPDGAYDLPTSTGGAAAIDVRAQKAIRIEGSTLDLRGGSGLSPGEPLTFDDIGGEEFSGGDAILNLVVYDPNPLMVIKNSVITLAGGDGGDAPDGQAPSSPGAGGRGGGFTRGGDVTGNVARGGDVLVDLRGRFASVSGTSFDMRGGRGGNGGDGGPSRPGDLAGGGGGGYTGGDGAHVDALLPAMDGGQVYGHVGTGGSVGLWTDGESFNLTGCGIDLHGGAGGSAGRGGASHGKGGGGGGGYSGGGGGANHLRDGAAGGDVDNMVGRGGSTMVHLSADGVLDLRSNGILAQGGIGGTAGDGGNVTSTGGGGGGGCSGGGGGAQGPLDGSRDGTDGGPGGDVGGIVASGGDAEINLSAYTVLSMGCSIKARGGDGGPEGRVGSYAPGVAKVDLGGAGGGALSGGGGAGRGMRGSDQGQPGEAGYVSEGVAMGGDTFNRVSAIQPTISADSTLGSRPGEGAEPLDKFPGSPLEGNDASGEGMPGKRTLYIPMSRPLLVMPFHESAIFQLPRFTWIDVHDSTTHGNVTGYIFVVDDDEDFTAPEKLLETHTNGVNIRTLPFDVHYWYVRAVYEDVSRTFGPMSPVSWFYFYNAPPKFRMVDPLKVFEGQITVIDMSRYVSDPDTRVENLTLYSEADPVVSIDGLNMTLKFDQPATLLWVRFSVSDGYTNKWFNMPVQVIDVNDPPVIVSIGGNDVPVTVQVREGQLIWLDIVATDPEGESLSYTMYTNWQDMRLFSNGSIRIWARRGLLVDRTAKLLVEDERHAITSTRITIKVVNTLDPPESILSYGPKEGSSHKEWDPVTFTVKVIDPDLVWGEEVNVTWESDRSGVLGTRRTRDMASIITSDLPVGQHTITITVNDGTFVLQSTLNITIVQRPVPKDLEQPPDQGIPPLAILLLIVMPLLGYYLGRRGVGLAR